MLDDDVCYRALASRDARFDGRFFTGVRTTGIYCRPICPARRPARKNVSFFQCAAAAEASGFRACKRCRPEAAPGTPAWLGTSATVSRALRLIDGGELDTGGVAGLAARLGIGERHLRRLFLEHVGATPVAVAQTRRAQLARALIDETSLPMTEVAFAAGYASVRRFNGAIRRAYGATPRALRKKTIPRRDGQLCLRLPYRPPLPWTRILEWLAVRATPGVAAVEDGLYRRTIAIGGAAGIISVRRAEGAFLELTVPAQLARHVGWLVNRARDTFDLGADPEAIAATLGDDSLLGSAFTEHSGVRVPGAFNRFEVTMRAILGQQVSVRGATTLAARLAERFGEQLSEPDDGLRTLFPTPSRLRRAQIESIGLPQRRGAAIRGLAAAIDDGDITLDGAHCERDALLSVDGIGPWTADYIALRALREPDAFPAGDLALRKAVSRSKTPVTAAALARRAESWRPWRAYAAVSLWWMQA